MLGIKKADHITDSYTSLKQAKNLVSILLLNAPNPTLLLAADYHTIAFNDAAAKLFLDTYGWTLEAGLSFLPPRLTFPGHPLAEFLNRATHGLATTRMIESENKQGDRVQFQVSCTPILDEDNQLQSIYLSLLEQTISTPASTQVKKLQDLVNAAYHSADIGIAMIDENGYYLKTNDGYNDLFGYAKGELDGKHYAVIIPPENHIYSQKKIKTFLNGNLADKEMQVIKKNGEYFTIYRTARLLQNSDNTKSFVVTARDVSETRRFQQILMNTEKASHLAGWEMEIATMKVTCTAELYNILELTESEFSRLSYKEMAEQFLEKNERHIVQSAISTALHKGKPFNLEIPVITRAQNRKWLSLNCTPDRFNTNTIKLRGTVHDITDRKSNEFELERLSMVDSKTNNAIFITDKNSKTIWLNESVQKMTGYDISEFMGKKPGDILHGKDTNKATIQRIRKALKARKPVSEIILNYKKDGSPFWINMEIAPILKNGLLENFIGIGVDITEIIKAKESLEIKEGLEHQQKLFTAIANNFPDGIIGLLDKNLVYIFAGGTDIKKLGLTENDFIGKRIFDHLSPNNNKQATVELKKAIAGDDVAFEVTIKGKTYSVNAVPAQLGEKEERLILVVLHNITLHKKAEQDLLETLKKEKELGELKTRFVSMASHEFRTPLSTVLSSAYLIEKYSSSEEQPNRQKHLRRIVASVETLTEILEDFLSLGKIEEGKIQVRLSSFNICNLITETINELQYTLRAGQQILYWHHGWNEVVMDHSLLKHILMNLVSNASKFSPENSQIEINTFQDENLVILSIRDQGMGITIQDQQHLMERFFRGANAGNIQGTGLGLHIVSKYAELMNGTVVCSSKLEEGTTFTITFYTKLNHHEKNPAD